MAQASPSPPPFLTNWSQTSSGGPSTMLPSQRADPYLEPTQFESDSAVDSRVHNSSYDLRGSSQGRPYGREDYLYQEPPVQTSTGRVPMNSHGPRRPSSFGTLASPLAFGAPSPASSVPHDEAFLARSRSGSATTSSDMLAFDRSPSLLLPGFDEFGSRRGSKEEDLWSSRTRWMTEQGMYRDSFDDPLAVEELSPGYFASSPSGPSPFSPTASSLRRSASTYSMSSSHRSAQYGPDVRPVTPDSRGEAFVRRRSITSDAELASPSKRSSPRKVAQVTTAVDSNGSPTKSIRRIAKLNLDASPSKQHSPSQSPRKSPRKNTSGNVPIRPAPDTTLSESSVREVEQILGEIGPVLQTSPLAGESAQRAQRRVSFASSAAGQARVPSVLLPPAPIEASMSRVALEHVQLVDDPDALERIDLSPQPVSSAPAWRSSFDLPTPPDHFHGPQYVADDYYRPQTQTYPPMHYPSREVNPAVSSFTLPANPHARLQPIQSREYPAYANGLAVPAPPYPSRAWTDERRRSSASSYEYVPASSRRYPVPAVSAWSASGMPMHQDYDSYPPSYQDPRIYRLPAYGSSSASSSSHSPASDSRPATPPPVSRITPIPITPKGGSPTKIVASATKASPGKKKRSPAKSKRQPGAMFVNYSAVDAKKLLNGVAPSGSTRKRREEEEARRRAHAEARDTAAEVEAHSA